MQGLTCLSDRLFVLSHLPVAAGSLLSSQNFPRDSADLFIIKLYTYLFNLSSLSLLLICTSALPHSDGAQAARARSIRSAFQSSFTDPESNVVRQSFHVLITLSLYRTYHKAFGSQFLVRKNKTGSGRAKSSPPAKENRIPRSSQKQENTKGQSPRTPLRLLSAKNARPLHSSPLLRRKPSHPPYRLLPLL